MYPVDDNQQVQKMFHHQTHLQYSAKNESKESFQLEPEVSQESQT